MEGVTAGLTGGKALLGEVGTLAAEGTTFTALDYLETGELTPESLGTSFGMALAGRAAHPLTYIGNLRARYKGEIGNVKPPRLSKEMRDELSTNYPELSKLLADETIIDDIYRAFQTAGQKKPQSTETSVTIFDPKFDKANRALDRYGEELERMKSDPNVPWSVVRMAEWVLNGKKMPQPAAFGYTVTHNDDGSVVGITQDANGRTIERFKIKDEKEEQKFVDAADGMVERNAISLGEQQVRSRQADDNLRWKAVQ